MPTHTGSCLCGGIRYEVSAELSEFGYCHCQSCRKASGSAFGANAGVDGRHLTLHDSDGLLRRYESSPGKIRTFCSRCGSPIFAYLKNTPELVRLRLGTLDTPFAKQAKAHTFVGDKADWETIAGDTPQFATWADRSVLEQVGSKQP